MDLLIRRVSWQTKLQRKRRSLRSELRLLRRNQRWRPSNLRQEQSPLLPNPAIIMHIIRCLLCNCANRIGLVFRLRIEMHDGEERLLRILLDQVSAADRPLVGAQTIYNHTPLPEEEVKKIHRENSENGESLWNKGGTWCVFTRIPSFNVATKIIISCLICESFVSSFRCAFLGFWCRTS